MAFAFNKSGGSAPTVDVGSTVPEIETESLGFSALGPGGSEGPKKLKLLPSPWPSDSLPPASATLISVASQRGLLAAAGPDTLILSSTQSVRKAFEEKAGDGDVITTFTPDASLPVPRLRHVAFSSHEDFLVLSSENGGLAVYGVDSLLQQSKNPEHEISTDGVAIRALLPNPNKELEHIMAVVLESGKLCLIDIVKKDVSLLRDGGVTCAAWSVKGKAVVAGLEDGSGAMYMNAGQLRGTIPRPPDVEESWSVSALYWLNNDEFLFIHSPSSSGEDAMADENIYHFVRTEKTLSTFSFHKFTYEPLYSAFEAPARKPPPRFSVMRLRNWEPDLDDMLIVTGSHTTEVMVVTSTSNTIASDQQSCNEYTLTGLIDSRKAQIPRMALGEEGDSVPIGEALDLSSKEKIPRPIPMIEEINESPFPLPAYMLLTHQGLLMAWWVVWNRSIENSKPYPGLTMSGQDANANMGASQPAASAKTSFGFGQPAALGSTGASSPFGKPAATFGTPSTPQFGATGFGSTTPAFGKPAQPAFGKPAQPAFGKPAQPAFGATSAVGSSAFGAAGGLGNKQSPWASTSQTPTAQSQPNPFAAAAGGASGFAKFGSPAPGGGSTFSSFGSSSANQSFGSFGQQKSTPSGAPNGFKGLSTEPSFGSTVTIGSSGVGSTLPSWASNTPAQQGGSGFGQATSSFGSTKESDMSDADDENRQRDEATPTPQAPPTQTKGLFGVPAEGFKLGSTFKGDGTAKDDGPKPAAPSNSSLFGGDFASALGGSAAKTPFTPVKQVEKDSAPQDLSTTPATVPKTQNNFLSGLSTTKETATPKVSTPPVKEESPEPEEAPLPPDFVTSKPAKGTEEELPPLAGSPAIQVEVSSSPVESSNLDEEEEEEEEDGFSVEEQEGDEETEEPSPSDAMRRSRPSNGWALQASVNQSPQILPAAPTPPVMKSGTSSVSGRSTSPPRAPVFGQASKPPTSQLSQPGSTLFSQQPRNGLFGQGSKPPTGMGKAPSFAPPSNRNRDSLRSPSPVRAASTSVIGTRREPFIAPGASLSASVQQQPKPLTPQPQVSDLEDDEDERIRNELAQEIEPSRTLDQFIAHHDYTGKALSKTGHAAQIELLYRDINSMVDTLGLNSRSLQAFIEYHKQPRRDGTLTQDTLEDVEQQGEEGPWYEEWSLCEITKLKELEENLERELDEGRVQDVLGKLGQLARLLREKAKLMTRLNDIRRQIINRKDPEKAEAIRKAPLPKELADGQKTLRNEYARLLTLLNQAEEATVLLRSRLASHHAEAGKAGAVPTVDAVKKTIIKMTNLAEKRNNDIVLLESQLRKIGLAEPSRPSSSSSARAATPTRRSRGPRGAAQSPFATPPASRSRMSLSELNRRALTPEVEKTPSRGYGLSYTQEEGSGGKELLSLGDMVDDNIDSLREMARRRRKVASGLKKALVERGVKTTKVN